MGLQPVYFRDSELGRAEEKAGVRGNLLKRI